MPSCTICGIPNPIDMQSYGRAFWGCTRDYAIRRPIAQKNCIPRIVDHADSFASVRTVEMPARSATDATQFVNELSAGEAEAADQLLPLVYDELRALARRMLGQQAARCTLQPTALVHEAYLKLVDHTRTTELGRTHFFNLAAQAMRQVLADHARRRCAAKRGGNYSRVSLGEVAHGSTRADVDVVNLDDALTALAELDARQARIVEMRFLAGMTIEETAIALGISPRTVQLDWRMARAWLRRRLSEGDAL